MIIDSTNKVWTLEDDLMPFLFKEKIELKEKMDLEALIARGETPPPPPPKAAEGKEPEVDLDKFKSPNFHLSADFPWIAEARKEIKEKFDENIIKPMALLKEYKKYEYVLNVDSKKLIKELFSGEEKADIDEIRRQIDLYETASYEILNVSNNTVEYPLFRIEVAHLKESLFKAA
jgi:hypothetical protein